MPKKLKMTRMESVNLSIWFWEEMLRRARLYTEYSTDFLVFTREPLLLKSAVIEDLEYEIGGIPTDKLFGAPQCSLCAYDNQFEDDLSCRECPAWGLWSPIQHCNYCDSDGSPFGRLEEIDNEYNVKHVSYEEILSLFEAVLRVLYKAKENVASGKRYNFETYDKRVTTHET